ncbi:MAG: cardiolipin synthase [Planctomycetia bacterium]|nr:cardiolipin synthase [Planctomycetia bacterium]
MRELLELYWDELAAWGALVNLLLTALTIAWALTIKRDQMSALAWCLVIIFLPFLGVLLFALLGWQQVQRPVARKQRHKQSYRNRVLSSTEAEAGATGEAAEPGMARLALRFDASPVSQNRVTFYHEGEPALHDQLAAIRNARHHIHLEYFIFQPDDTGRLFLDALEQKARAGVEVRLLYDAMGSHRIRRWCLRALRQAGGRCGAFLPLDPLRRRIQINMRNHRKIAVIDGQIAFCGGLNIGDEYRGKSARFGYWRDTHLRLEGPAAADLQRVFVEDWDFAMGEHLQGDRYFPPRGLEMAPPSDRAALECAVQVIQSGPDQQLKGIREIYFAAISQARRRLWIASPYFVPDAGLRDILCLAGWQGVDVRLLCQFHPDKWIPYYAGRYYWADMLDAGVRIYQYAKGMMHSKVMLLDDHWASVGTANLDNRSLHLNFEVNCLLHTPAAVTELEAAFLRDLDDSIQLDRAVFAERPFAGRLVENVCRLLSPML